MTKRNKDAPVKDANLNTSRRKSTERGHTDVLGLGLRQDSSLDPLLSMLLHLIYVTEPCTKQVRTIEV